MSRAAVRSLDVLTLLFLFVVVTPHPALWQTWLGISPASVGRILTIWGVWLAAQTTNVHLARLIASVSLQVYRKPASMFMTHPLPAVVQMFSVMWCLQPTHVAVEVFTQSHGRYLRVVASAAGRWTSSIVTCRSWWSPIVVLSIQLQIRAGVLFGCRGTMINCAHGTESIRENSMSPPK